MLKQWWKMVAVVALDFTFSLFTKYMRTLMLQQFSYTCKGKHRVFKGCLEYKRKRKERRNTEGLWSAQTSIVYRAGCVVLCIVCVCDTHCVLCIVCVIYTVYCVCVCNTHCVCISGAQGGGGPAASEFLWSETDGSGRRGEEGGRGWLGRTGRRTRWTQGCCLIATGKSNKK